MEDLKPIGLRLELHHEPFWFAGLLTWIGAFTTGSPWSPACWLYILGIVSLHSQVSQFPMINIFMENKNKWNSMYVSVQFICSVMSDSLWPLETVARVFPVLHYLPEFAQTHVHWVIDAIQPSHHLFLISPPALNLYQHQGLFQWVSSSHQLAKVLEFQLQHQSFQWIFRTDFL